MLELKTAIKQNPGFLSIEIYLEEKLAGSRYSTKKVLDLSFSDAILLGSELINKASMFSDKISPLFPKDESQEAEAEIIEEIEEPVGIFQKFKNWVRETL